MKIVAAAAVSKNGFLTNGTDPDPRKWTSNEDKEFLKSLLEQYSMQIMGSTTYELFRPKADPKTLRVVLTKNPHKYEAQEVKNQLVFLNASPKEVITAYISSHSSCLLLGGSYVYNEFFEVDLVNEVFVTVEPVNFESGTPFLQNNKTLEDYGFKLLEKKPLNSTGTSLHHYRLERTK